MRQAFITLPEILRTLKESMGVQNSTVLADYAALVKPAVVTISIFAFVQQWNELLYPLFC